MAVFLKRIFTVVLSISCSVMVFETAHARIIYGVERIPSELPENEPIYVQAGVFRMKENAYGLRKTLIRTWHAKVTITEDRLGRYVVVMGPLSSKKQTKKSTRRPEPLTRRPELLTRRPELLTRRPELREGSPAIGTVPRNRRSLALLGMTGEQAPLVSQGGFFAGVGAGLVFPSLGSKMTIANGSFYPPPYDNDFLFFTEREKAMIDVFWGYRFLRDKSFFNNFSLALRYQYFSERDIGGALYQYAIPEFDNYNWHWGISSNVLSLMAGTEYWSYKRFAPYVDAGMGLSLNQTNAYSETAKLNVTPRIDPQFIGQTTPSFTWYVGTGLNFHYSPHYLFSLGYEFQDLGNVHSGSGKAHWSGTWLSLNHYQTNTILLGASYLFGDASYHLNEK